MDEEVSSLCLTTTTRRPSQVEDDDVSQPLPPKRTDCHVPEEKKGTRNDQQQQQEEEEEDEIDEAIYIIADLDSILHDLAKSQCDSSMLTEIILATVQEHGTNEKVQDFCMKRLKDLER